MPSASYTSLSTPETRDEAHLKVIRLLRRRAADALQRNDITEAHTILCKAKSLKIPLENIDYLRALVFLKKGEHNSAQEALKEELRYFPCNQAAKELLKDVSKIIKILIPNDNNFKTLYEVISPYTMVGLPRLYALYSHACEICKNGPEGNFVECGVVGGGSSALLSAVIARFAPSRRLFSCDSFDGMPPATDADIHNDQKAEDSGWGTGTCAAPESSVLNLCNQLGTEAFITPIKGYFEDTLPKMKDNFGSIAFLHMDGDWYSSTKAILDNLYDKLIPGAYIQVDDFGYWEGCRKAVIEFFQIHHLKININVIDDSGIWFRKP